MAKYTPVYWDVDLQMASMIESAQHILEEQQWTDKSYIFIFIDDMTIHICYVHADGTEYSHAEHIDARLHIDARQISDSLNNAVRELVDIFFVSRDREIRVVLAGLPSRISTESSADTFEFLNSTDMKVDTITTKERMQELATFAERSEDDGGLKKSDGSNTGKNALNGILHAMPDDETKRYTPEQSQEDWVFVCGNQYVTNYFPESNTYTNYWCQDDLYKTNHLPPAYAEAKETYNYMIVPLVAAQAMVKINFRTDLTSEETISLWKVQDQQKELLRQEKDVIMLVTAGHTNEIREQYVQMVEMWLYQKPDAEPALKKTRLATPFTYVGREFTDRCVYALPKI